MKLVQIETNWIREKHIKDFDDFVENLLENIKKILEDERILIKVLDDIVMSYIEYRKSYTEVMSQITDELYITIERATTENIVFEYTSYSNNNKKKTAIIIDGNIVSNSEYEEEGNKITEWKMCNNLLASECNYVNGKKKSEKIYTYGNLMRIKTIIYFEDGSKREQYECVYKYGE